MSALFCAVLFAPFSAGAQSGTDTRNDPIVAAFQRGEFARVVALAAPLIGGSKMSANQWMLLAIARTNLGDHTGAKNAAITAYHRSKTADEKFTAARSAARASFAAQKILPTYWWLRRASNHAGDMDAHRLLNRDFRVVRAQTPWSGKLDFAIAPSTNFNGGSNRQVFHIGESAFQLAPESRALSGLVISGRGIFRYRVFRNKDRLTAFQLGVSTRTAVPSPNARVVAPNISTSDYNQARAYVALEHGQQFFRGLGPTSLTLTSGLDWYATAPHSRFTRWEVTQGMWRDERTEFSLGTAVEFTRTPSKDQISANLIDLDARYRVTVANGNNMQLSVGKRRSRSRTETSNFRAWRAHIDYSFAQPIFGALWRLGVGYEKQTFPEYSLPSGIRQDKTVILGTKAEFRNVSYFGFFPSVEFTSIRTHSNISRFTSESLTTRLAIETQF